MPAVYFDLDGTLVESSESIQTLFDRTCNHFGVNGSQDACQTFYDQFFEHLGGSQGNPYVAAAEDMVQQHQIPVNPRDFADEYTQAEVAATTVDRAIPETLEYVSRQAKLGVITNGVSEVQREKLLHNQLDRYFEIVFSASETGAPKPQTEMFELASKTTPADSYVYVGDSVENDMIPAKQLGFSTVLIGSCDSKSADMVIPEHSEFGDLINFLRGTKQV